MKKRIAVFANGWSDEFVQKIMNGVQQCMREQAMDVYVFAFYSASAKHEFLEDNPGEENIFRLPDLSRFDGVIVMTNTFASDEELKMLRERISEAGIPGVSLEWPMEGLDFFGTDNYSGMYELTEHLVEEHQCRRVVFVSGPSDNDESNIRLQAVKDALAKHGLEPEEVICGYFSFYLVGKILKEWLEEGHELPDAFMCANDAMAMATSNLLRQRGYRIPEDVLVTGFDCLESARQSRPSITSVKRGWDELGYRCASHLLKKLAGEEVPEKENVASSMEVGESCGCHPEKEKTGGIGNPYEEIMANVVFNNHFRDIFSTIRKVKNREQTYEALKQIFTMDSAFEGENFAICVQEDFFSSVYEGRKLPTEGYSRQMETLFCFCEKKPMPIQRFDTVELLPEVFRGSESSTLYVFAPLHIESEAFGYACLVNHSDAFKNYNLYNWTKNMSQYLEQIRQNIRLEKMNERLLELSVKDALTGVYNRTGYEIKAMPYLKKCREEGKNTVLMLADINRMKLINDRYGHLQGDLAIRIVADAIADSVPHDWIVVRYGGDEFLVVGACESQIKAEEIKRRIFEEVVRGKIREKAEFPLSISLGDMWMSEDDQNNPEECFKKADDSMYRMKKKAHEEQLQASDK